MMSINFPDWDKNLFLFLHQNRIEALSPFMVVLSSYLTWVVIFLIVSYFMIRQDRIWGLKASVFALLGIGVNSLVNNVLKEIIARPRPTFEEEIKHLVNALGHFETNYSFFSAHSSNSFCFAVFVAFYFKNLYVRIAIILWAVLVAYSRIFVGQHYPIDILAGTLFGILIGYISYRLYNRYKQCSLIKNEKRNTL